MKSELKLTSAAATLAFGMMATTASGQAQTLELKTDNVLRVAHVEENAKPVFVDFDGDGDLDLFIGGKLESPADVSTAGVRYFRNDDTVLNEAASPFPADLGLNEELWDTSRVSPGFIDLDGDLDLDAFLGLGDGTIAYFRNDEGAMVGVSGAENPFNGVKVGDSFNASPSFVDIDGDGDLDAVIGKYDGQIAYFRNDDGVFNEQVGAGANPFDGFSVTESATPTFADLDGDGDLDLFVGNKEGVIAFFENNDGAFTEVQGAGNPFDGRDFGTDGEDADNIAPAFADIDADGDLDLFVGLGNGEVHYYRNDDGVFNFVPFNTIGITDVGGDVNHGAADLDGDGDQDVYAGLGDGIIFAFANDGGQFISIGLEGHPLDTNIVKTDYFASPAFADIDGDGDLDAFSGSYEQNIRYFQNTDGSFTEVSGVDNPFDGLDGGQDESIAFVDWDGDGDLDAFIGNKAGEIRFFENTDGKFAAVTGAGNPFDGISFQPDFLPNAITRPAFADIDNDGDQDAYIGTTTGMIRVFENDGEGNLSELTGEANIFGSYDFGRDAAPTFSDLDGDGDMDLLIGNAEGLTYHFENLGPASSTFSQMLTNQTRVYPNPTSSLLQIETPWNRGEASAQLLTLSGQVLREEQFAGSQINLALGNLPSGVYLLRIIAKDGMAMKKIVKR